MSIENGLTFLFWLKVVAVPKYEVVQHFLKKGKVSFAIDVDFIIIEDSFINPSKLIYKPFHQSDPGAGKWCCHLAFWKMIFNWCDIWWG